MGKKKKTGSAHSDASHTKLQAAGRIRTTARSGTGQVAPPSIIPLHIYEPFQSQAIQRWRIEATLYEGPRFNEQWQGSVFFDNADDAWDAYTHLRKCRTVVDWDNVVKARNYRR